MPKLGWSDVAPEGFMGCYLLAWGGFTFFMFLGTLGGHTASKVVFGTLTLLFGLLAANAWTESALIGRIAGYEGIVCGTSACYLAVAEVLNETYGRTILPVG